MRRFLVKRLGLALVALVLVSMLVFATAVVLPGDASSSTVKLRPRFGIGTAATGTAISKSTA